LEIDLEKVRQQVISPGSIKNHLTSAWGFSTIIASGYATGALIYQGVLSLNLSAGTRSTIEDFGVLFEPQKAAVSAGRIVRNAYFAWFGRVVFNLLTNPVTTMQELTKLSSEEQLERATSSNFLTTFLGRFLIEAVFITVGITILFSFGDGISAKTIENILF